jgi:hypothetical protein
MVRVFVAVAVAVEVIVFPARVAALEIATANPAGAAWTALADRTIVNAAAVVLIPRRDRCSRNLSSARETRF